MAKDMLKDREGVVVEGNVEKGAVIAMGGSVHVTSGLSERQEAALQDNLEWLDDALNRDKPNYWDVKQYLKRIRYILGLMPRTQEEKNDRHKDFSVT